MDPLWLLGVLVLGVVLLYLGQIMSFLVKAFFFGVVVVFLLVFLFGVSLNQMMDLISHFILLVI